MTKAILFGLLAVCACGPVALDDRPDGGNGGSGSSSGSAGSGSGSGSGSAAAPVVDTITCKSHVQTSNVTNQRQVHTIRFALVDGIDPQGAYQIEMCDYNYVLANPTVTYNYTFIVADSPCPDGATCNTSGDVLPTAVHACSWSSDGTFLDGKLYIQCGRKDEVYDGNGALVESNDTNYGTIRVHH